MRIGIIAPARELDRAVAARTAAFAAIAFPEVDLVFHPQCFLSSGHFAGTDDQRATAFLEMANDPAIDALWFGRGGYGSNRSEEHTSELQSLMRISYAVFCLKKTITYNE